MQILYEELYGKSFALPFLHAVKWEDIAGKQWYNVKSATRGWQKEAI